MPRRSTPSPVLLPFVRPAAKGPVAGTIITLSPSRHKVEIELSSGPLGEESRFLGLAGGEPIYATRRTVGPAADWPRLAAGPA